MSDKPQTIVIDNGTGNVKAGFGGETVPRTIFPSMVGRPKKQKYILKGMNMKEVYVGREASRKKGILKTIYPLAHGVVTDWDDMTVNYKKFNLGTLGLHIHTKVKNKSIGPNSFINRTTTQSKKE